jgi:hypothetical protein
MTWRDLRLPGLAGLEREVAVFVVHQKRDDLPMTFRVRIVERPGGTFSGYSEIAFRDSDGTEDWIAGTGATEEEALADTVKGVLLSFEGKVIVDDASIAWAERF